MAYFIQMIVIKKIHINAVFFFSANLTTLRNVYSYGFWNWLASLTAIITVHLDKWLITALLGLETFGYYSIGILLFNQVYNVLASSVSWVFPKIAKGELNLRDAKRIFYSLTYYILAATLLISFIVSGFPRIFVLWLGEESYSNSRFYIESFSIILPVFTLSTVSYYYILAVGQVKEKFIIDIVTLFLKVLVLYLFIYLWDFEYWPYSFLIFLTFQALSYFIVIERKLEMHSVKTYSLLFTILIIIVGVRLNMSILL
jgi:O-antigen/teichoic acid export membrane protein